LISQAIDQIKQKAIVDFAAIGLIALRHRGYLDMGCTRKQALDVFGKIAVNNLTMIQIKLQSECITANFVQNFNRIILSI